MRKLMFRLFVIIMVSLSLAACSDGSKSTVDEQAIHALCDGDNYKADLFDVILNKNGVRGDPELFFIHNISQTPVWLNKAATKTGEASAGWASLIAVNRWSALAVTGNFHLTCSGMDNGRLKTLDCSQFIKVCDVAQVRYEMKPSDSYWVAESQLPKSFLSRIEKRGIILQSIHK